jgi:hypothetical protein
MKKIFSLLSVLFIFSTMVFATGKDDPSAESSNMAVTKSGSMVKVYYKSDSPSLTKIEIIDKEGRSVFSETLKSKQGFMRPYNLSSLPAGTYTVKVSDDSGVKSELVTIGAEETMPYVVKKIQSDMNKYALLIPGGNADQAVVSIYESDRLIHRHTENVKSGFAQIYNLKQIQGDISFVVTPKK